MKPIPEIGKVYKFYDDGKARISRQYDALVLDVITKEEAKAKLIKCFDPELCVTSVRELYDVWKDTAIYTYWLFAKDTDRLIECDIPSYDANHIWFARTINGSWFSMNIQSFWQSGVLDVTNELTEKLNSYETI